MNNFFLKSGLVLSLIFTCTFSFSRDRDTTERPGSRLPVISFAQGLMYYLGDVGYTHPNQPVTSKSGLQLEIQKHTNTRLSISLFILGGRVAGQEKTTTSQLNFESGIVAEGLQLRYDFYGRNKETQVLTPFISAGVEYMLFSARGDLKDANGNYYHYWDDGSIRNMAQHDSLSSQAAIIHRDYSYETDLRDENLDGFGNYRQSTIGFPVGAGVKFRISNRVAMHFGVNLHLTQTDLIDNVSSESVEGRKGDGMKDKIIFTFVSFRYDMSGKREVPKKSKSMYKQEDLRNVNLDSIATTDSDHDGIDDVNDAVIDSTLNTKVDANGKPVDTDNDGIPDYRDKEPASLKDALVNEEGITITEEMIEAKWREDSLAALPVIVEYLHHTDKYGSAKPDSVSSNQINELTGQQTPARQIPPQFNSLDEDKNNQISPGEIGKAIDLYLDGKSKLSVSEFYDLIDFFFSQQ
jgi:hypothetical protein